LSRLKESVLCADATEISRMHTESRNRQYEISDLVEKVKSGNKEAFMALTQLYQRKVFQLAYSYFRNKEDALDIVQETFLRYYYRKHHKKNNELRREDNIEEMMHASNESGHHDPSSDLKNVFSRCLEKLSDKQRMIFVMKHYNQLQYNEIAQILDIALGTVKSLHFKAVRNLRTHMSPYMGRMG
jgi:RNA polymerase sigma-70 factor (ECF subfamily)